MNIAIESHLLNHSRRSGLLTYTEGLGNGLYQNDTANQYELIFYSLRRSSEQMPGPGNRNFKKIVVKVPDQEFSGRQWLVDHLALPASFKKNKIRIFHRLAGYTLPEAKDVFKVLTIHDLRTLTIQDAVWSQNIERYRRTVNKADRCVVVSECTKRDVVEHLKIPENKVRVTYLGADRRFQPAQAKQKEIVKAKYRLNEPFLLSIGSVPRKNIEGILKGFAGSKVINSFILVLSCNLDVEKYKALAAKLGVAHRVKILDKLSDDDVVALYSACHSFVFPSLYEGFGLPILEAMQCGAAVITSNGSSCPEVAGDAAILVDPKNAGEISDAINQMCSDERLRQNLIQKGFERAKLFSWNRFAQEMIKVYEKA